METFSRTNCIQQQKTNQQEKSHAKKKQTKNEFFILDYYKWMNGRWESQNENAVLRPSSFLLICETRIVLKLSPQPEKWRKKQTRCPMSNRFVSIISNHFVFLSVHGVRFLRMLPGSHRPVFFAFYLTEFEIIIYPFHHRW